IWLGKRLFALEANCIGPGSYAHQEGPSPPRATCVSQSQSNLVSGLAQCRPSQSLYPSRRHPPRARERSRLLAIASAGDVNKSPGKRTAAGGIDQVSSRSIAQEENVGLSFPRAGRKHRQRHWAHMSTLAGNHAAGDSSICNVGDVHEECRFGHEDSEQHAPIDTEDIDPNASSEQVPKVGLTFESEDAAYKFYNSYARKTGFSVRKCHTKHRADGTLASKYMVCSNEGHKNSNPKKQPKKERASTRSECKARVQFYVSREDIWKMQKVVLDHSHPFTSPDKTHMLRSQRLP
ncbi:hypothetical protein EJB05_41572, partial [Eragrostis curvula]